VFGITCRIFKNKTLSFYLLAVVGMNSAKRSRKSAYNPPLIAVPTSLSEEEEDEASDLTDSQSQSGPKGLLEESTDDGTEQSDSESEHCQETASEPTSSFWSSDSEISCCGVLTADILVGPARASAGSVCVNKVAPESSSTASEDCSLLDEKNQSPQAEAQSSSSQSSFWSSSTDQSGQFP
jgi:hypothetical protein